MSEALPLVIDTSPLIHLTRADSLSLLSQLGRPVFVPDAVQEEIQAKGSHDVTARNLERAGWLEVVPVAALPPEVTRWDLGAGEEAVLAWCHAHPGASAVLDDAEARRCARSLGVPVFGTLGIVLQAKREGRLPAARPVVELLVSNGMYLSRRVLEEALSLVGE